MASKPSIVELENFVKILCSNHQLTDSGREEDVKVLSTNSDGTRKTVWGPVFFHPKGSVVSTYHPDKPQRRIITGPCVPAIPLSAIYSKEWVKDGRWHSPVIQIKGTLPFHLGILGRYPTCISAFCFDSYNDDAGVCHWVIDTIYEDIIGMKKSVLPSQDGIWCLARENATLCVDAIEKIFTMYPS